MAHVTRVLSQQGAPGERAEAGILKLIHEKERELTELVLAARREAEGVVGEAQRRAEDMVANAATEAVAEAEAFLRAELAKVDHEARAIVAHSETETETIRKAARERMASAVEFITGCVAPGSVGKEER